MTLSVCAFVCDSLKFHFLKRKKNKQHTAHSLQFLLLFQGPCYINFDRFPVDHTKVEEEFSGWDQDF